ncbi:hypothetical protein NE237_012216 [Protea cynaroides]|uniref:Cotton fiber protein n=1 Tax=Protea cynaroides TaxID=273540 RepID=A0A9Q0GZE0_9MAGN|nr:hypothetical protein NE237_012216 [Protea cynaroides]
MEGKGISKRNEQSPPTRSQAQSIETNGGVLAVKDETGQAISKSTRKKSAPESSITKKRSIVQLFRAALFMILRGSNKKSKSVHVEVASKGLWRRIVGSMRPLHLHDHKLQAEPTPPLSITIDILHEPPSPMSPQTISSPSSSQASNSTDSTRLYASAPNLQELGRTAGCNCHDDIDEIEEFSDCGDEMIDVKAEEFIARFYEQMRLQRLDSIKRYNQMIDKV